MEKGKFDSLLRKNSSIKKIKYDIDLNLGRYTIFIEIN